MATNRRDFLKGTAWMGVTAALSGRFLNAADKLSAPGYMSGYAAPALKTVRVGHVGLGMRGPGAVHRMAAIPGVKVAALCDLYPNRVAAQQKWLTDNGHEAAAEFSGPEGYKALCESDIDLVYITSPWHLHVPIALYAMEHGKHVAIEVPAAMNMEECWACVETSERTGKHCMQLENCCYGAVEMFCLNMARQGAFGEIMHGEGAYIHDLRDLNYLDPAQGGYQGYWRLKWNADHHGNPYPTHGLVPIMQAMNINRGDQFDYLTCVSTRQHGMDEYAKIKFGENSWQAQLHPKCGDMSTTVIKTILGRTIMIQHDVTSARPYSRINTISGTKGIVSDYPFRVALAKTPGGGAHEWMNSQELDEVYAKYEHPLWHDAGLLAQKMGGHGGMDFLMDLRLIYCLQNGLPLDMDVYDLAASCSLCELTERSALNRGQSQDIPDFTRGGWKTAKPLGIETVDLAKLGLSDVTEDKDALNV